MSTYYPFSKGRTSESAKRGTVKGSSFCIKEIQTHLCDYQSRIDGFGQALWQISLRIVGKLYHNSPYIYQGATVVRPPLLDKQVLSFPLRGLICQSSIFHNPDPRGMYATSQIKILWYSKGAYSAAWDLIVLSQPFCRGLLDQCH